MPLSLSLPSARCALHFGRTGHKNSALCQESCGAHLRTRDKLGCRKTLTLSLPGRYLSHGSPNLLPLPTFSRTFPTQASSRPYVASLGFSADPRQSAERIALQLLRDTASLLVYQNSLKGPQAQTFLRLLLTLSRGDDTLRILEAYGEFYRNMQIGERHASWQDCLLESILSVEDCPFVSFAASAPSPSSPLPPHLLSAAAADLSTLQRLAVAESTVVGWIASTASELPDTWRKAAETERKWGGAKGKGNGTESSLARGASASTAGDALWQAEHVQRWREALGGSRSWGEAHQHLLQSFHWHCGYGAPALHHLLGWKEQEARLVPLDRLAPQSLLFVVPGGPQFVLGCQQGALKVLLHELLTHVKGDRDRRGHPHAVLLHGPQGMGKTQVLLSAFRQALEWTEQEALTGGAVAEEESIKNGASSSSFLVQQEEAGNGAVIPPFGSRLRVVELRKESLKSLPPLLHLCSSMPQLRFVLCCDGLSLKPGEEVLMALQAFQGVNLRCAWPSNVMLLATSRTGDALRPGQAAAATAQAEPATPFSSPFAPRDSAGLGSFFSTAVEISELNKEQVLEVLRDISAGVGPEGARKVQGVKGNVSGQEELRGTVSQVIDAVFR